VYRLPKAVTHLNTFTRPGQTVADLDEEMGLVQAATEAARDAGREESVSVAIVVGAEFPGWQNRVS
jgi:hypothetical protein